MVSLSYKAATTTWSNHARPTWQHTHSWSRWPACRARCLVNIGHDLSSVSASQVAIGYLGRVRLNIPLLTNVL